MIAALIGVLSATIGFARAASAVQPVKMQSRIASLEAVSEECKANNPTELGLRSCAFEELQAWDKELNVAYRLLMDDIGSSVAGAALQSVQRAWLAYRDAEFEYIESKYAGVSGSMYPRVMALQKIPIVKKTSSFGTKRETGVYTLTSLQQKITETGNRLQ